MKIEEFDFPGVQLITPEVHCDPRGYLLEAFNQKFF